MNARIDLSNVVLETKCMTLRPWKETDLDDFYEYAKVDGVAKWPAGYHIKQKMKQKSHSTILSKVKRLWL